MLKIVCRSGVPAFTGLRIPRRVRGGCPYDPGGGVRIMDVVRRADGPVMVKQVCGDLGTSLEPARSRAMRAKLNRLTERDWLRKLADGKFTSALRVSGGEPSANPSTPTVWLCM
ncbi:hypothetical protein AB0N31_31565 [Streptomyces sp. NPDC051051]|uniref:hypothetical protein n=1 Tax=Streptomyces sp. NPDC051051 TaxID=3155666 RepID=UPI00342041C2